MLTHITGAILVCLSSLHYGFNISILNSISSTFLNCTSTSYDDCIPLTTIEFGWIVGIMYFGCLVGSLIGGFVLTKYTSLIPILMTSSFIGCIGNLFCSLASNSLSLCFGRFIIGIGIGSSCLSIPLYLLHNSPSMDKRALYASINPTLIGLGILLAELIGRGIGGERWRILFAFGTFPFLIQMIFLPFNICKKTILSSVVGNWNVKKLLKDPITHKSLMISAILHIGQQLSGINAILQYSSLIFKEDRGIMIASVNLIMGFASLLLVERIGRRWIGLGSSFWMTIGILIVLCSMIEEFPFLASFGVILYISSYSIGLGSLPWIMVGELFPSDASGVASSIVISLNWIFNMIVSISYPFLKEMVGYYSLLPFAIFMGIFFIWALFSLPETKGRPMGFIE